LLARHILGPEYKLIPFKKSRYYSYPIPIADDTIVKTGQTIDVLSSLGMPTAYRYHSVAISIAGQLLFNKEAWAQPLVDRLYRDDPHPLASALLAKESDVHNISIKELYESLLARYGDEIISNKDTVVSELGDHFIVIDGQRHDAYKMICTIPLNASLKLAGVKHDLQSHDYHVSLVASDSFNLEGAERVFIADMSIPFWKVNVLGREAFQFFSNGYVENVEAIFALMTKNRYRMLATTSVPEAFPLGPPPMGILQKLNDMGIVCVGSNARWDYFYDVSTSLNSILNV